jgi:hypothetical protein
MFADPLTELPPNLNANGMRLYSDLEVETLIDEVSEAAFEAIEQAAGEAARAAALAAVERGAVLGREMQRWKLEADTQKKAVVVAKKAGVKNAIIAGAVCLASGLALGVGGTMLMRN